MCNIVGKELIIIKKWKLKLFSVCRVTSSAPHRQPILWSRTHHITTLYITPQTLSNFNLHYFIIILSYPIFFTLLFKSNNFYGNYIFLILCV